MYHTQCKRNNCDQDRFAGALLPFLAGVIVTSSVFYINQHSKQNTPQYPYGYPIYGAPVMAPPLPYAPAPMPSYPLTFPPY